MQRRGSSTLLAAGVLAATALAVPALGAYGGQDKRESSAGNPCLTSQAQQLRCPNLRMSRPSDLWIERTGGKRFLHSKSSVDSRGRGPVEVRGTRIPGTRRMRVRQWIFKRGGGHRTIRTTGRLAFYPIPGQGHYWKFRDAARFQVWTVSQGTHLKTKVRTGPKFYYCLRDLFRNHPNSHSPKHRVYPGCSQDSGKQKVRLGTSTGWSDVYPSSYHEQYINVTGLRGCYAMVHVADPKNHIRESNESDNRGKRFIRLPSGRVRRHC